MQVLLQGKVRPTSPALLPLLPEKRMSCCKFPPSSLLGIFFFKGGRWGRNGHVVVKLLVMGKRADRSATCMHTCSIRTCEEERWAFVSKFGSGLSVSPSDSRRRRDKCDKSHRMSDTSLTVVVGSLMIWCPMTWPLTAHVSPNNSFPFYLNTQYTLFYSRWFVRKVEWWCLVAALGVLIAGVLGYLES